MPRLCASRPAIVYMATNLINGSAYIGVTIKPLKCRASQHWRQRVVSNTAIGRALRKYGRDLIRFRVLKKCASFDDALVEEVRLIAALKPRYNLTSGGEGSTGSARQRKVAAEIGKRVAKRVICINTGEEFPSAKAADIHFGFRKGCVSYIATGYAMATKTGLKFSFVDAKDFIPARIPKARPRGFIAHNRGSKHTDEAKRKMRAWHVANPNHAPWLGKKRHNIAIMRNE